MGSLFGSDLEGLSFGSLSGSLGLFDVDQDFPIPSVLAPLPTPLRNSAPEDSHSNCFPVPVPVPSPSLQSSINFSLHSSSVSSFPTSSPFPLFSSGVPFPPSPPPFPSNPTSPPLSPPPPPSSSLPLPSPPPPCVPSIPSPTDNLSQGVSWDNIIASQSASRKRKRLEENTPPQRLKNPPKKKRITSTASQPLHNHVATTQCLPQPPSQLPPQPQPQPPPSRTTNPLSFNSPLYFDGIGFQKNIEFSSGLFSSPFSSHPSSTSSIAPLSTSFPVLR